MTDEDDNNENNNDNNKNNITKMSSSVCRVKYSFQYEQGIFSYHSEMYLDIND